MQKHGIKQVDRLLSNEAVDAWKLAASWVPYVLAKRTEAVVALDWTDFEADDHTTLVASLVISHGRTTLLLWLTLQKSALAGNRAQAEDELLLRLKECVPAEVKVTILADRGFADQRLYALLAQSGFEYVVRFRKDVRVEVEGGHQRPAAEWIPASGQAKKLAGVHVTADRPPCPRWCWCTRRA